MANFHNFAFLLTMFFLLLTEPVTSKNPCTEKCGKVRIQFPFHLKNNTTNHTNPQGFELSCTDKGETMLEIPTIQLKLFIKRIDYKAQKFQIYDPKNCLARQLLKLGNLSVSPFQFQLPEFDTRRNINISFFHCDSNKECPILLRDSSHDFIDPKLVSCRKVSEVLNVGWMIEEWEDDVAESLIMKWSKPNCSFCEVQGKKCKWKNGTRNGEVECFVCKSDGIARSTVLLITTGVIVGSMILLLLANGFLRIYRYFKMKGDDITRIENFLEDYRAMKPTRFTYADIKRITNGFKENLGEGAHGAVFKGMLSQEILVAVKVLNETQGDGNDFINEVRTMGKIHHFNVVRLLGFCADGFHRALVYDFFPNGSLQKFLAPPENNDVFLGWEKLQRIALGVARGIEYLHIGCDHRILHFDINPHNVLIDDNLSPKITDFGLAKLCPKNQSTVSITAARGTLGYIAPEVFSRNFGNVSYKSDIYSYGILLLEMVGGRKNTNVLGEETFQVLYPEWIHNLIEDKDVRVNIEDEGDVRIAKKLALVGLWCIQWNPVDRPSMKTVVQMLEGDGVNLMAPPTPFDSIGANRTNQVIPPRHLNFELEVIPEID
ncbi:putative glycerophosphodiester phosphodiesterase, protein kinase RLK-Pelle-LRK10L-2 family [Medicago truncatula]|uniref:Putative glycerophosphodiester phosphodiesterase, protein kinase RLK-Pelle-LRK10L-2 family n=1 Tax=Medicago truncatula TaxID=3880 RepID=A0A072VG41_MEDTR|nr:rust resistance kinase Lr10 [Medicago truncatula]KEH40373.1 receptor-like kinase [Medicago truncatula]RHN77790.1 putative glycerophosphodiester phosphodiesterase, protein kinase RLK-Pelle-LRK10L-2 family [Medicago truncatula]